MTNEGLNRRRLGEDKEVLAAGWLRRQGMKILARNFRCRQGEIDLIALDEAGGPALVFIEVKYRKNAACGHPEEAVDVRKQRVISKVALFYLARYRIPPDTPLRFDVVAIEGERIRWIRNAFSI